MVKTNVIKNLNSQIFKHPNTVQYSEDHWDKKGFKFRMWSVEVMFEKLPWGPMLMKKISKILKCKFWQNLDKN